MADIALHWDFQDEVANSTILQINRQKSARNLVILEFDPSEPRAAFFDPTRDQTHVATLTQCDCHDFTRLKVPKPCMHIYRLAIELGLLEAKYLDRHALSSFTSPLSREETEYLRRLPPDPTQWGCWALAIHASGIQRNRQYRGYSIHHVERSVVKSANGWLIHEYTVTLEHCECPDFSDRKLPCKHIYAAALGSNITLPFTYTEFDAARHQGLSLVYTFPMLSSLALSSFGGLALRDDNGNPLPEGAQMTDGRNVYIIQHGFIHQMTKADIDEWFRVRHGQLRGKTLVMYHFDHQAIVSAQADAKARAGKKSSDWTYASGGGATLRCLNASPAT